MTTIPPEHTDALRESERKYRELFASLIEACCVIELIFDDAGKPVDFLFLETNPAFEEHTTKRMLGKRAREVVPELDQLWLDRYGRVATTGEPARFEHSVSVLGDKWFRTAAFRLGGAGSRKVAVVFENVTDRRRVEAAQAADLDALTRMHALSGRLVGATGFESLLQEVVETAVAIVHSDQGTLQLLEGETLRIVAHLGHEQPFLEYFASAERVASVCGEATRQSQRVVVPDVEASSLFAGTTSLGVLRAAGVRAVQSTPMLTRAGRLVGILSTHWSAPRTPDEHDLWRLDLLARQTADLIEQKQAEQRLVAANLELAEADRRKNEFMAVLSHELRNPLAPITNSLYVLEHAQPASEQAERARQVISRQVAQLSSLVNDLLDITRITRNKVQLQKERLELNELVRRVVEDNRSLFERGGVALELSLTHRRAPVRADHTRLAQIVGNLLQNCAKFTSRGGHTWVSVEVVGPQAIVRVRDDGLGISRETLERLFQPFMQEEQALDRSKGGLGLGLALVKGLVELHGGTVVAHSEGLGRGTELTVRLPLDTGAEVEVAEARVKVVGGPRRVLIIEDNVDAAASLKEALEFSDHEVWLAHSGPDGIAKAREFRPDVVLCDIGLPGMDGYDVARAFRADEALRGALLVALTGYALPQDLRRATEAGFSRHLAKPPVPEKLEELVAEAPRCDGAISVSLAPEGGEGRGEGQLD